MSWSTSQRGQTSVVAEAVKQAIVESARHDEPLQEKAAVVAEATAQMIAAFGPPAASGKELVVSAYGHIDQYGISTYSLTVATADIPAPITG